MWLQDRRKCNSEFASWVPFYNWVLISLFAGSHWLLPPYTLLHPYFLPWGPDLYRFMDGMEETPFWLSSASRVLNLRSEASSGMAPSPSSLTLYCKVVLADYVPHSSSQGALLHVALMFCVLGTAPSFVWSDGWKSQDSSNAAFLPQPLGSRSASPRFVIISSLNDHILPSHLFPTGVLAVALVGVVLGYSIQYPASGGNCLANQRQGQEMRFRGNTLTLQDGDQFG